jgi:hypothetical protein
MSYGKEVPEFVDLGSVEFVDLGSVELVKKLTFL